MPRISIVFRTALLVLVSILLSAAVRAVEPLPQFPGAHPTGVPVTRPMPPPLRLTSNGREFLALSSDGRYGNADVVGWRFSSSGDLLDEQAFPVVATWRGDDAALAIWNGIDYGVFSWTEYFGTFRVRLSKDGEVNAGAENLPWADGIPESGAWNGSRYCVAFVGVPTLQLRFFDAALATVGTVDLGSTMVLTTSDPASPVAVTTDGSNFLAVWATVDSSGFQLLEQMFDGQGTALGPSRVLAATPLPAGQSPSFYSPTFPPAVSWNGNRFLVAWAAADHVAMVLIDRRGVPSGGFEVPASVDPGSITCAWDGYAHLVVWSERDSTAVQGALVSSTGNVTETVDFGSRAWRPAVAGNDSMFLVLSGPDRFAVHSTGAARVTRLGPSTVGFVAQTAPTLTAGPSALLAAWNEGGRIYASRIGADGQPLDGSGLDLGSNSYSLPSAAASANDSHLVLWQGSDSEMRFARITNGGEVLDRNGTPMGSQRAALTASSGRAYVVVGTKAASSLITSDITVWTIPTRGGVSAPVPLAKDIYNGLHLDALVWTGREYALLWHKPLDPPPPCISSFSCGSQRMEPRLTTLREDGSILRDVPVAVTGTFIGAASDDIGLLAVTAEYQTITTWRIASDGSSVKEDVIPIGTAPRRGAVLRAADGFEVLYPASSGETRRLALDSLGRLISPEATVSTHGLFGNAARAFGSTWMMFTAAWIPLPNAHPEGVSRTFYTSVPYRRRSVHAH